MGLYVRIEGVKEDEVKLRVEVGLVEIRLVFAEGEEWGDPDFFSPFASVEGVKEVGAAGQLAVVEPGGFFCCQRIFFKAVIGDLQVVFSGMYEGEVCVQPCAESGFQNPQGIPSAVFYPCTDEDVQGFLNGSVYGVIVFVEFGNVEGGAAVFRPDKFAVHFYAVVFQHNSWRRRFINSMMSLSVVSKEHTHLTSEAFSSQV